MGLSLVGYLSVMPDPNLVFVAVLMGLGQLMLIRRHPGAEFLALQFYPSCSHDLPSSSPRWRSARSVQALRYRLLHSGAPGDRGPHRRGDAVRRRDGRLRLRALHEVLLRYAEGGQGPKTRSEVPAALTVEVTEQQLEHLSPRRPDVLLWPTTAPLSSCPVITGRSLEGVSLWRDFPISSLLSMCMSVEIGKSATFCFMGDGFSLRYASGLRRVSGASALISRWRG